MVRKLKDEESVKIICLCVLLFRLTVRKNQSMALLPYQFIESTLCCI